MENLTEKDRAAQLDAFNKLIGILHELRNKCPWDQEQTMSSLRPLTIEETFELSEAILAEDIAGIKEELGDLLLHILLYARIAAENNEFTLTECIETLCNKLIRRHPHIFQKEHAHTVVNSEDVKKNWQRIKLEEKSRDSILEGIPASLPSLIKAICIRDKASSVGFRWETGKQAWEKVQEEVQELVEEVNNHSNTNPRQEQIEDEFGDVLATLITYARFINVDPDKALEKANQKFIKRFQQVEHQLRLDNKQLSQLSVEELKAYWNQAKAWLKDSANK
ncbi:MAG: nucleoside triphosphate pyrophosphohydrolase [Candidatus Amoebophilus sp. 36-38]|nr:MAG: nucleoside triphosphate pyrophosphohydrolase [Candidatus Amoebophilus sp. 36-38]